MRQLKTPSKLTLAHGLMLLAGLMTFILVSAVLNDRRETSMVLVATQDAPAGSEASALALEPVAVPLNHPLSGQFAGAGSVTGAERISRDVQAGQPLLGSDLIASEQRVAVRTFAIPIDDLVLRGLKLRVDDRVDVIGQAADGSVYFVVTDVVVSSLSQLASDSGFAVATDSFVTIEVTDLQALALSGALREASVDLVRSTGAQEVSSQPRDAGAHTDGQPQDTTQADTAQGGTEENAATGVAPTTEGAGE